MKNQKSVTLSKCSISRFKFVPEKGSRLSVNIEGLPGGGGGHVPLFPTKFPRVPVFSKGISSVLVFPVP